RAYPPQSLVPSLAAENCHGSTSCSLSTPCPGCLTGSLACLTGICGLADSSPGDEGLGPASKAVAVDCSCCSGDSADSSGSRSSRLVSGLASLSLRAQNRPSSRTIFSP